MKLIVFATHPIQYQIPLFRELDKRLDTKVVFLTRISKEDQVKTGFATEFEWDVDLTNGYEFVQLDNTSRKPNSEAHKMNRIL